MFEKLDDKWRRLRNAQAVKSIIESPIYGKQSGQGLNVETWPSAKKFEVLSNEKGLDFSRLRLHKVKW